MITKVVFAPVQTRDVGEQELLQHIFYLAKRSVAVDNGASVSAIKLITYIYEVSVYEVSYDTITNNFTYSGMYCR